MDTLAIPAIAEIGVHAGRFSAPGMDAFFIEHHLHQERRRLVVIAVDAEGLVNVAKEDVARADAGSRVRLRAAALSGRMVPGKFSEEDVETCLKDLGVLPCDLRRGIAGDTAVSIGSEMVRQVPHLAEVRRIDLVEAIQFQILGLGLSSIMERIGSGRLELSGRIARALNDHESLAGLMRRSIRHLTPLRCPEERIRPNLAIAKAFPGLILGLHKLGLHEGDERSVLSAALKELEVPPGLATPIVRRLAGVSVLPLSAKFVEWLGEIPIDWIPSRDDPRGWRAIRALLPVMAHVANETETPLRRVCGDVGGDWDDYGARLCARLGFDWQAILDARGVEAEIGAGMLLKRAAFDLMDVARSLADTVIRPCLAHVGADEEPAVGMAAKLLFQDRSFAASLVASATWHRRGVGLPDCDLGNWNWAPLLPSWTDRDSGVAVEVLVDRAALVAEGAKGLDAKGVAGLGHCVGGYGEKCLRGQSSIVSLRKPEGDAYRRLSTAEIRIEPDGVKIVQHRGMGNGEPPAEAAVVFARYLDQIDKGILAIDRGEWDAARRRRRPELEQICGYDWRDRTAIEAAFRAWRGYLPKRVQDLDFDGLAEALGVASPGGPTP